LPTWLVLKEGKYFRGAARETTNFRNYIAGKLLNLFVNIVAKLPNQVKGLFHCKPLRLKFFHRL